ncbi:MAG TPA: ATP-binding protein [Paracoccaceae bacterium]|nr:ATP-binding protein [Paracoccaceae bacterium]
MQKPLRLLKRSLPRGLFGRALLILVLPIVLLQLVVALVFVQRHYDSVTEQMAGAIQRELQYAVEAVEDAPNVDAARRTLRRMSGPLGFELLLQPEAELEHRSELQLLDRTGREISKTLRRVGRPIQLDLVSYEKHVDAAIATEKGVVRALIPRRRLSPANPHLLFVWMAASAVLLTTIAILFLRNQVRPIRELAKVATAFGHGRSLRFRPSGADEVRRAGAAFLDMRARIERHVEQRTQMLSGVSHDLRTPLTRMKLALAVMDETPETEEIARDIDEMVHMLDGFLAFARGEDGEPSAPASPVELAEEVASDARHNGVPIEVFTEIETPDSGLVEMRRGAMKRGLSNLVENAAIHGDHVFISVRLTRKMLEFTVEDDGPGIPPEMREEVLRPFVRLDEARNQDLPGTGLGLSIALDVARSHGGALSLDESPQLGGLRAILRIPR